ncbi:MAG: cytidylyltransferase domain-containing protein [Desulfotomaculales bacterium]
MARVVCIVQARTGSTRLPGKVLRLLAGRPMLSHLIERLRTASTLWSIVIATTQLEQDDRIVELAREAGVLWYRGPEEDVLARYVGAAEMAGADVVVRVTGDCPLIDPVTVDSVVRYFLSHKYDYVAAGVGSGFPRGLDTEVFTKEALVRVNLLADDAASREHVTLYIYRHPEIFRIAQYSAPPDLHHPEWRLCVDEEDDFRLIEEIYNRFYRPGSLIDIRDVVRLLEREPELKKINAHVTQKVV